MDTALPPQPVVDFAEHRAYLCGVISRVVGADDVVQDLVQVTLEKAVRAWPKFRGEALVRSWLTTIALHVAIDHKRLKRRPVFLDDLIDADGPLDPPEIGPGPEDLVIARAEHDRLGRRLSHLPSQQARCLVLYSQGWEYHEIAELLGIPEGTVKSTINRARANMTARS